MVIKYIVTQALKAGVKKAPKIIRKADPALSLKQKKSFKGPKFGKTLTADKGEVRISEINKKLRNTPRHHQQDVAEDHAQEVLDIYNKGKK